MFGNGSTLDLATWELGTTSFGEGGWNVDLDLGMSG